MSTLEQRSRSVQSEILDDVAGDVPALVVAAPPGAGKSRLVVEVAGRALDLGRSVVVAAPTRSQVAELCVRLADAGRDVVVYGASGYSLPAACTERGVQLSSRGERVVQALRRGCVVVATVAKLAATSHIDGLVDLLVVDEAWQVPDYVGLRLGSVAARLCLVGDPGQIPPVVRARIDRFASLPAGPQVAFPAALVERWPDRVARHHLVASRRVPPETAEVLTQIFYPEHDFGSLAPRARLGLTRGTHCSATLEQLATGATLVLALVEVAPVRDGGALEERIAQVITDLVAEIIASAPQRIGETGDGGDGTDGGGSVARLDEGSIGVVCGHIRQVAAVAGHLESRGVRGVRVETAERWQGLEREIMIAWHPAGTDEGSSSFCVEAGRLCVMASRHKLSCVIVAPSDVERRVLDVARAGRSLVGRDEAYDGAVANLALVDELRRRDRVVRLTDEGEELQGERPLAG
jgi:rhodanese-related sulfurtransferase